MTILEMKQKRFALVKDARKILDTAEAEKREVTAEEKTQYDKIFGEVDSLGENVVRMEKQERMEKEMGESEQKPTIQDPADGGDKRTDAEKEAGKQGDAFRKYLRGGVSALSAEEFRAMQVDDPTLGGYLLAPQKFVADLLKDIDDEVVIRQSATIHTLEKAASLGVVTLDADMEDADWTAELKTGTEDKSLKIGKRELKPNPLAKEATVSNTLLRQGAISVEDLVRNRLAYKFGITEEKAYMVGDGHNKPLGLFVASDDGIPASRDVSEDMNATEMTADGIINVKYALKTIYQKRAKWLFHRNAVRQIRKMKDGNGQYIWVPGLTKDKGDELLESPMLISEYVPATFSSGKYVGLYGDFKYYWIVDCLSFSIQRLVELYAKQNKTGFIGRYEGDGQPVLAEAFIRIKLG